MNPHIRIRIEKLCKAGKEANAQNKPFVHYFQSWLCALLKDEL